ncbi:MAG: hypothetical protein Q9159_003871 [Coniocarpon cinnabarinum]
MGNSSSTPKITPQDKSDLRFPPKPTSKILTHPRAILDLKVQRDKLHQYQKKITHLTALETNTARSALAQHNRRAALLALRRKKYQETLLTRTDQQLAQLEKLAGDVEFALVQKDVVFGLQRGTEVLKAIRKEMGGVAGVEKMMGRNEEEVRYQEEIGDMLNGTLSSEEEDDVEEELRLLEGGQREDVGVRTQTEEETRRTARRWQVKDGVEALPDAPNSEPEVASETQPGRPPAKVEEPLAA